MTSPQKPAKIKPLTVVLFFVLWLVSGTAIFGIIVLAHPSLMGNQNILVFAYVIGLPIGALYVIANVFRARIKFDKERTKTTNNFSSSSM